MDGVYLGDLYSNDHDLILTDVDISLPTPRRTTIDIEGRNGSLDLTTALSDTVKYQDRDITLEFAFKGSPATFDDVRSELAAEIHGQYLHITLDTDPDYYWDAFAEIDDLNLSSRKGTLTVKAEAFPYKYKLDETTVELELDGEETITLSNEQMVAVPTVTTTDEITITVDDSSVSLSEGEYILPSLALSAGDTEWTISGTATVTITYQEGRL